MFQNILFLLLTIFVSVASHNCQIKFKYSKICHFYKFDEKCINGQKEFCKLIVTKRDELKCPYYICPKLNLPDKLTTFSTNSSFSENLISKNSNVVTENEKILFERENVTGTQLINNSIPLNSSIQSSTNRTLTISHVKNFLNETSLAFNVNSTKNVSVNSVKKISQKNISTKNNLLKKNPSTKLLKVNNKITNIFSEPKVSKVNRNSTINSTKKTVTEKTILKASNNSNLNLLKNSSLNFLNSHSNLNRFSIKNTSDIVKSPIVKPRNHFNKTNQLQTLSSNSVNNLLKDSQKVEEDNWHEVEKIRNFTKIQKDQKEKHRNITSIKLEVETQVKDDKKKWIEVEKIAKFSKFQKQLRQQVDSILVKKIQSKNMEVDCVTKTCRLEFREMDLVIFYYFFICLIFIHLLERSFYKIEKY